MQIWNWNNLFCGGGEGGGVRVYTVALPTGSRTLRRRPYTNFSLCAPRDWPTLSELVFALRPLNGSVGPLQLLFGQEQMPVHS